MAKCVRVFCVDRRRQRPRESDEQFLEMVVGLEGPGVISQETGEGGEHRGVRATKPWDHAFVAFGWVVVLHCFQDSSGVRQMGEVCVLGWSFVDCEQPPDRGAVVNGKRHEVRDLREASGPVER